MGEHSFKITTRAEFLPSDNTTREERVAMLDALLDVMSVNDLLAWLQRGENVGAIEMAQRTLAKTAQAGTDP